MRFTCEKSTLVSGLNIAGRTVAQKSSLPVIEGILCRAEVGLSLTGYNMETAITYDIEADVMEAGECILPAKLFGDIIRRLPEGPVTVVVGEDYKVSIRAGYASFSISAESAEDYPELPDVNSGRPVQIPQNQLKELISGTIFAVSENQGRPIHTGVKFEVTDDSITAVAVDGFRLARRTYHPAEGTGREMNFVVPSPGLKEVEKIVSDVEDLASFTLGPKHILFQIGKATLVCRLLEGPFVKDDQVGRKGSDAGRGGRKGFHAAHFPIREFQLHFQHCAFQLDAVPFLTADERPHLVEDHRQASHQLLRFLFRFRQCHD